MIAASIIMGRALAPVELAVSQWRNFSGVRDAYKRINDIVDDYPDEIKKWIYLLRLVKYL
jgi:ABC-type protease/lipase transport system fused ATPase/permease subunit